MSSRWPAPALVTIATVLGCRPFEGESASPVGDDDASVVADAAADSPAGVALPASCKALLEREPGKQGMDGIYEIDPDGPDGAPPIRVFCDLTLDRGGWTLVGRSSSNATDTSHPFGWRVATGDVTDESQPYSLDVARAQLAFTEVLVADVDRTRAYRFSVSEGFLTEHVTKTTPTIGLTTVLGDCTPDDHRPTMLRFAGATSFADAFFLRDIDGVDIHTGLRPSGFALVYPECERGGNLEAKQGIILVR